MNLGAGFAIYFIFWWLALLIVMPFGVRTQEEVGEVEPGTIPSAHANPMIRRRLILATLMAAAAFAVYYVVWVNDLVTLEDFPIFDPPSAQRQS